MSALSLLFSNAKPLLPVSVLLALTLCAFGSAPGFSLVLICATNQVAKYEKLEFSLAASGSWTNPFDPDEVDLSLRLTSPSGKTVSLPAFWFQPYERSHATNAEHAPDWMYPVGMPVWKARFAPVETGQYQAVAWLTDSRGTNPSGLVTFECVPSQNKGFLRVSPKDPRFFAFTEGQPFFAIGQNLAFIGSQQYVTLSKAEAIFGELSSNGANYLRIWTCCDDWALAIESRKSAFGRSWDWHPPIVPIPDDQRSGRKCLRLSGDKNSLRIDPAHPVALRPGVRYTFSGKARLEPRSGLELELNGNNGSSTHWERLSLSPLEGKRGGVSDLSNRSWQLFKYEFQSGPSQMWLGPLTLRADAQGTNLVSDLSLREASGGPELLWEADVNRPTRGYYNPLDSFMLDELVSAAERKGIFLQLCFLARDLYMSRLKDPASSEYARAIHDARSALRYAVARWGYSTSVAAWEYWNEMDPGLPAERFYTALGEFLEQTDPYHHLRTTSTWGPSAKDCRHPMLDVADVHFYLRPIDKGRLEDEVDAVLERTRWLRQQAPAKPAHLGEFGLANDKWQPTDEMNRSRELVDFHNGLWASALSGASGTAMFWWWERLDQRSAYAHYAPVSRFIADVPWNSAEIRTAAATCSEPLVRLVGLQAKGRVWLWLFNRDASWRKIVIEKLTPRTLSSAHVELKDLPDGPYRIAWYDTRQGRALSEQTCSAEKGALRFPVPAFTHDLACKITAQ